MHSTENQRLAIYGFGKIYSKHLIPEDISNLITKFYDTAIFWMVSHKEISTIPIQQFFAKSKDDATLYGPQFMINTILFQLKLERTTDENFQLQLFLPNGLGNDHQEITATVELFCHETNTKYKKFAEFDDNSSYVAWRYYALSYKHALKYKTGLTLSCDVQLLSIKYQMDNPILEWIKPMKINPFYEQIHYEWKIKHEILHQFKNCKNGISFWPQSRFGISDNFCIYCCPNGCMPYDEGNCVLFIQLLALPYPMKEVYIKYKMECMSDKDEFYVKYEFSGELYEEVYWPDGTLLTEQIKELSSIKFVVTMELLPYNPNSW